MTNNQENLVKFNEELNLKRNKLNNFLLSKKVKKLDLKSKKCLEFILNDLYENNIDLEFIKIKPDDLSGLFDPTQKKIKLSNSSENIFWFSVLLHEYCHFRQWHEKTHSFYKLYEHLENYEPYELMIRCINSYNIELDCEKRVVSLIRKWKLPIDVKMYTRLANAYVLSHLYICLYGKKIDFNKLYTLLKIVPVSFRKINHYKFIKKHEKVFEKMVIKKCTQYY